MLKLRKAKRCKAKQSKAEQSNAKKTNPKQSEAMQKESKAAQTKQCLENNITKTVEITHDWGRAGFIDMSNGIPLIEEARGQLNGGLGSFSPPARCWVALMGCLLKLLKSFNAS